MTGRSTYRLALLASAVILAGAACTSSLAGSTGTPSVETSPSSSPSASASSTPSGGTSSPVATPTPTASPVTTGVTFAHLPLSFHLGEVGLAYAPVTLAAVGGVPPYTWSLRTGSLPAGMSLSSGGVVSGTPTAPVHVAQPTFEVMVRDSTGAAASTGSWINVVPHLSLTQPCANQCSVEAGCTVCGGFGTASGGAGPLRYAIVQGAVPTGMGWNGLSVTGAFPGGGVGAYMLSVAVTDQLGVSGTVLANWFVFDHITLSPSGTKCSGFVSGGCSTQFTYSGGTPNGTPVVHVSPSLPAGFTYTIGGGVITLTVTGPGCQSQYANTGYNATVTVTLTDQSICGPGNCTSDPSSMTVSLAVC